MAKDTYRGAGRSKERGGGSKKKAVSYDFPAVEKKKSSTKTKAVKARESKKNLSLQIAEAASRKKAAANIQAVKAARDAKKITSSKTSTAADKKAANKKSADAKRAANKKSADAKRAANVAKKAARVDTGDNGDKSKASKTAKGKFFFGTNIPLSAVKDSGKRDEINARLKTDIAAGDWVVKVRAILMLVKFIPVHGR
jgi:colicin import membrane protein